MNLEDDVFDEIVRQKIRQRDFGSPSSGWEKAEKMIVDAMPATSVSSSIRMSTAILLMLFTGLTGACVMYFSLTGNHYAGTKIMPVEKTSLTYATVAGTQTFAAPSSATVPTNVFSKSNSPAISSGNPGVNESPVKEISAERMSEHSASENTSGDDKKMPDANNELNDQNRFDRVSENTEKNISGFENALVAVEETVSPEKHSLDSMSIPEVPADDVIAENEIPLQNDSVPSLGGQSTSVNFWFLQGGAGYSAAFSRADPSGRSINPVIGGGYNVWLSPRVNLQAGLRYTFINNASDTSSTTLTGISGPVHQYNETRLQRLHYFSLPLQVYWRFAGRHSLTGGYALNYLAAAENREHSFTESNNVINTHRSRSVFGREQGLNRFDGMFMAGYAFTFNAHFSAEATCYTGLTDIKNNGWYGVNRFERNRGFMLLVQYSF